MAGYGGTPPNAKKGKFVTGSPWAYSGQSAVGNQAQGYTYKKAMHSPSGQAGHRTDIGRHGGSGMRGSKNSGLRGYP